MQYNCSASVKCVRVAHVHMPEQCLANNQREREKAGKAIKLKLDGKMDTVPNICFSSIKQSENKHMGDESSYQRIRAQWVC